MSEDAHKTPEPPVAELHETVRVLIKGEAHNMTRPEATKLWEALGKALGKSNASSNLETLFRKLSERPPKQADEYEWLKLYPKSPYDPQWWQVPSLERLEITCRAL